MIEETSYDEREEMSSDIHKPARPLKFLKGKEEYGWRCNKDIDPVGDFRDQGC
jgi:hypothetical protein